MTLEFLCKSEGEKYNKLVDSKFNPEKVIRIGSCDIEIPTQIERFDNLWVATTHLGKYEDEREDIVYQGSTIQFATDGEYKILVQMYTQVEPEAAFEKYTSRGMDPIKVMQVRTKKEFEKQMKAAKLESLPLRIKFFRTHSVI